MWRYGDTCVTLKSSLARDRLASLGPPSIVRKINKKPHIQQLRLRQNSKWDLFLTLCFLQCLSLLTKSSTHAHILQQYLETGSTNTSPKLTRTKINSDSPPILLGPSTAKLLWEECDNPLEQEVTHIVQRKLLCTLGGAQRSERMNQYTDTMSYFGVPRWNN